MTGGYRSSPTKPLVAGAIAFIISLLMFAVAVSAAADSRLLLLLLLIMILLPPLALLLAVSAWLTRWPALTARRYRLLAAIPVTVIVLIGCYSLLVGLLNISLENNSTNGVYADCHKVWSTRGLVVGQNADDVSAGNNTEAIMRAYEHGARGVEIDVFYDSPLGHFIVSHDRPYELKDGRLLPLEELLATLPNDMYIWLDLKKLRHLEEAEAKAAVEHLQNVAISVGREPASIYVEGADPVNLNRFRNGGFSTIFDTYPLPEQHPLAGLVTNIFKAIYRLGAFGVMSMNYDQDGDVIYGPKTAARLRSIPLFIYHVPDNTALLRELSAVPNVRVLLVHDHQADRFSINACPRS